MGIVEGGKPRLHYKIQSQCTLHPKKEMDSSRSVGLNCVVTCWFSGADPLFHIPLSHCSCQSVSGLDLVGEMSATRKRRPFSLHVEEER